VSDTQPRRAAIYARVSTFDQEPENQLAELRRYVEARGWTVKEYTDRGVSGAKDHRPALDQLVADATRRRFDVLVCWRLDRLGRNLKHLIGLKSPGPTASTAQRRPANCRCTSSARSPNSSGRASQSGSRLALPGPVHRGSGSAGLEPCARPSTFRKG
jgi:hypothetical protein